MPSFKIQDNNIKKKIRRIFTNTFLIGISLIVVGILGLFSPFSIPLAILSALIGIFVSACSWYKSTEDDRTEKYRNQVLATQLLKAGMGNTYSEIVKKELYDKGSINSTLHLIEEALSLNPSDNDALAILSMINTLNLSFQYQKGMLKNSTFKENFSKTQQLVEHGLKLYPNDCRFHDAKGCLLDFEGKHEDARREFTISGTLRNDPGWHVSMATSWQMSGNSQKALEEINNVAKEVTEGTDYYYGRTLQAMGKYEEAQVYLKAAIKNRKTEKIHSIRGIGWYSNLFNQLAMNALCRGNFIESIKYRFKEGFCLLFHGESSGLLVVIAAIAAFFVALGCKLSRLLIPFYRNNSFIRKFVFKIMPPDRPDATIYFMLLEKGHHDAAKKILCEIIKIDRKFKDKKKLAEDLCSLGNFDLGSKDFKKAETNLNEAIEIFKSLGQKKDVVIGYSCLCELYKVTEDHNMLKQSRNTMDQLLAEIGLSESEILEEADVKTFDVTLP
jgi:tetratricopeptide (TPR) repeat protein